MSSESRAQALLTADDVRALRLSTMREYSESAKRDPYEHAMKRVCEYIKARARMGFVNAVILIGDPALWPHGERVTKRIIFELTETMGFECFRDNSKQSFEIMWR